MPVRTPATPEGSALPPFSFVGWALIRIIIQTEGRFWFSPAERSGNRNVSVADHELLNVVPVVRRV